MNKSNTFSPEVRERAVRMVLEHRGEYPSSGSWTPNRRATQNRGDVVLSKDLIVTRQLCRNTNVRIPAAMDTQYGDVDIQNGDRGH